MPIDELLAIMRRLRDPQGGCPWDREQTFATIAPYTIEEAYEVADAIARDDRDALCDELGDLLFQVVFHAQMAEEAGVFAFDDVVAAIVHKMQRRHPHVFGDEHVASAAVQTRAWEEHKARERAHSAQGSVLDDLPLALPALMRAEKIGRRAARVGFDWPDANGARAKIDEELAELDAENAAGAAPDRREHELGDLLFSVVNLARHLGIDPENALRASNERFIARFRAMERRAAADGKSLSELDPAALDELWREAKRVQ
jgi:nucleoside triphosphate diphosphatase